ncbi:MAG: pentapeptide repeat-containing protein [Bacteroidota bacterium]
MAHYTENKIFKNVDLRADALKPGEYLECTFSGCNLGGVNLNGVTLAECQFQDCDLSLALLEGSGLRDVRFTTCKMLGLRFDLVRPLLFEVGFTDCILDLSSFFGCAMARAELLRCSLREVDLVGANLSGADLRECDLTGAMFEATRLERADLRGARGFVISPDKNRLKKAKFSSDGLSGLLTDYEIVISD